MYTHAEVERVTLGPDDYFGERASVSVNGYIIPYTILYLIYPFTVSERVFSQ